METVRSQLEVAMIKRQVDYLLKKYRKVIKPEYTPKKFVPRAIGAPTAVDPSTMAAWNLINNPINNPIYNPINNPINNLNPIYNLIKKRKRKEAMEAEFRQNMALLGPHYDNPLTDDEVRAIRSEILEKEEVLFTFLLASFVPFYIFYTSQLWNPHDPTTGKYATEFASFLSTRSGHYFDDETGEEMYKEGNPVLRWTEESPHFAKPGKTDGIITRKEMLEVLECKVVLLYMSNIMFNARQIEDSLQRKFQHLELGHRVWRCCDRGAKYELPVDAKSHKKVIVYSEKIKEFVNNHLIRVMPNDTNV